MIRKEVWKCCLVLLLTGAFLVCRRDGEEKRIREALDEAVRASEKKDLAGFMKILAPDYSDAEGRGRAETESLIGGYFQGRTGIVVHILSLKIEKIDPSGEAVCLADAAISSGAAVALRRLLPAAGEYYRFELNLSKKSGVWKVGRSAWELIGPDGLLPESMEALRKLLRGL